MNFIVAIILSLAVAGKPKGCEKGGVLDLNGACGTCKTEQECNCKLPEIFVPRSRNVKIVPKMDYS